MTIKELKDQIQDVPDDWTVKCSPPIPNAEGIIFKCSDKTIYLGLKQEFPSQRGGSDS